MRASAVYCNMIWQDTLPKKKMLRVLCLKSYRLTSSALISSKTGTLSPVKYLSDLFSIIYPWLLSREKTQRLAIIINNSNFFLLLFFFLFLFLFLFLFFLQMYQTHQRMSKLSQEDHGNWISPGQLALIETVPFRTTQWKSVRIGRLSNMPYVKEHS